MVNESFINLIKPDTNKKKCEQKKRLQLNNMQINQLNLYQKPQFKRINYLGILINTSA